MSERGFVLTVSPSNEHSTARRGGRRWNMGLALVGLGLISNAAAMVYTHVTGKAPDIVLDGTAFAQGMPSGSLGTPGAPMLGARGLYMMPAQLGPQSYGLYLMDVDAGTICVYQAAPDHNRFGLMAVRAFRYDSQLTDFNSAKPTPSDVQLMVEQQRQRIDLQKMGGVPTVNQKPKPDENAPDGGATTAPPVILPPILPPADARGAGTGAGAAVAPEKTPPAVTPTDATPAAPAMTPPVKGPADGGGLIQLPQ